MKTRTPTPSVEASTDLRDSRLTAETVLTRVAIVENRRVVRDLLERALRTGSPERYAVVGSATDSDDVTRLREGPQARVVVIRQEASDWLEVIRRLRSWPQPFPERGHAARLPTRPQY
jgi:CheY-like chemotaxis protein